jgi:hypothetical protein
MPSLAERIEQTRVDERLAAPFDLWQVRQDQVRAAGQFGTVYQDELEQRRRSYISLIPDATHAAEQLELDLTAYSERAETRRRLADRIERLVLPLGCAYWLERIPEKLRSARQTGCFGVRRDTGRHIVYWDQKASLSRLCPDDAREESRRLTRRVLEPMLAEQSSGAALDYMVLTTPNAQPGNLQHEMKSIYRRFRNMLPKFPQIKGALCVLEAPLGQARDWNVHLNVILVTRGFMDWKALRAAWHWNLEIKRLPKGRAAIEGALTELIKYAVAATVSKSQEKFSVQVAQGGTADRPCDSPTLAPVRLERRALLLEGNLPDAGGTRAGEAPRAAPPPMLQWTGPELKEWLEAFHAFRRTRTYGVLYRLPDPEPDIGPIVWLGRVSLEGGRYVKRIPLLDSIPEDKSLGLTPLERYWKLCRQMHPPPNLTFRGPFPRLSEIDENFAAHYAKKSQESVQK